MTENKPGLLALMGSGELADSMAKVHRTLLTHVGTPANAVFLDTPAGFELNADEISARAVDYFKQRFNEPLEIASFRSKLNTNSLQVEDALRKLRRANFIFAGPGSPSYAIRHWRGSAVWDTIVARLMQGASLALASAAAISVGCCSLPVYEIYKAGHDVNWIDGLDLLGAFGLKVAVMPHWNNAEGGTHDTRFCFMGEPRLKILEAKLPFNVVILGIDEYTACVLDLATQQCAVGGAGQVTVRYSGKEWHYPAGTMFSFDKLRPANLGEGLPTNLPAEPVPQVAPTQTTELTATTMYLEQLARAMGETGEPSTQRELIDHAHDVMHELAQRWLPSDSLIPDQATNALIELLVNTRQQLRAAKQYALADQVRKALTDLGIVLEDTSTGTVWKRA